MDRQTLYNRVARVELPAVPAVLNKLMEITGSDKDTSLEEVAKIVNSDPALTARVLRLINSVVYGFPSRILSVNHACVLLGMDTVRGIVLGVSVFEIMEKAMVGLWRHSLFVAALSRVIGDIKGIRNSEQLFTAGLLHDFGKAVLAIQVPKLYTPILADAAVKKVDISDLERAALGVTHAHIGGRVAGQWKFPTELVELITYHHEPNRAVNFPLHTAIIHFADVLARQHRTLIDDYPHVPTLYHSAREILSLSAADEERIIGKLDGIDCDVEAFEM
jgi:putative nucleotidyltransferase with HDIG domain